MTTVNKWLILILVAALALPLRAQQPTSPVQTLGHAPVIVANARAVGQIAAVASVASYTVGASDASFVVSANVLATVSTTYSFAVNVAFTDESNQARSFPIDMLVAAGVISNGAPLTNTNGPIFLGHPMHLRCKAGTTIVVSTSGTFTTVTYNVDAVIQQLP